MALTFPSSPTNGQIYTDTTTGNRYVYNSTVGIWSFSSNNVGMSISSTPPANVAAGAMWYNREIGRTFIYYDDGDSKQWVETVPGGSVDTNTIVAYTNPVFNEANAAYVIANNAYTKSNSALQNTSTTLAGTLDISNAANTAIGLRILGNTSTSMTGPNVRVIAYNPAYEVLNKDSTQNWYFGCSDDDSKALYIGRGYGPKQGVGPAIKVDISDRVFKPNQPMVSAYKTTGGWDTLTGYYIFNTAPVNVGSHYSTSTGLFTCPVAGKYRVTAAMLMGYGSGADYYHLYINGAAYASGGSGAYLNPYSTSIHVTVSQSWIINCATNDSLGIYVASATSGVYGPGWNNLTIELIG